MMDGVKRSITHFGNESLHIIDSDIMFADGESILDDLLVRYEEQPGFMFVCRALAPLAAGAHYCWLLFTDSVAIHYEQVGDDRTLHCWAVPSEVRSITRLVTDCCPF